MKPQRVVDSHVHFWDIQLLDYHWLQQEPVLHRSYLPSDLVRAAPACKLDKLVFIQADCLPTQSMAEAAWVESISVSEPRIVGIVARATIEMENELCKELEELQKKKLVCGVRRLLQSEPVGYALQPEFVNGVATLERYGLPFDICVNHTQLSDVVQLVDRCPGVRFVLDHLGKPDIKAQALHPWKEHLADLADHPNVYCKLSGMVTEADHDAWVPGDLLPFIEHAVECFGTARLMFGGDWPVSTLATSYEKWVDTLCNCLSHLGDSELDRIFFRNAEEFYSV